MSAGVSGEGSEIELGGPLLVASRLWTPELCSDLILAYPSSLQTSLDAGAFLCNYIAYLALRRFPEKAIGFLHVTMPSELDLETQQGILSEILSRIER